MQITIGCSYMQLGDKEQSMSHLRGPQMVLYTEFQRVFLANVWAQSWTGSTFYTGQMAPGQKQIIPVSKVQYCLHVILFGEEIA